MSEDGKATEDYAFDGSLISICSGSADRAAQCIRIPTCRIRLWCSGGGGPPSGEVLQEEAIFKSLSEPPPLEWLSSELLDILARVVAAGSRIVKRSDEGRWAGCQYPDSSAGPGITARIHGQSEHKRDQQSVWLPLVKPRRALQGCSCFCVREWMETWTRLWRVSLKLRRINESFADSRKFCHYRLSRVINAKHLIRYVVLRLQRINRFPQTCDASNKNIFFREIVQLNFFPTTDYEISNKRNSYVDISLTQMHHYNDVLVFKYVMLVHIKYYL